MCGLHPSGYYTMLIGSLILTFWDSLSFLSSRVRQSKKNAGNSWVQSYKRNSWVVIGSERKWHEAVRSVERRGLNRGDEKGGSRTTKGALRENCAWRVKPHQGTGDEKRWRMRRHKRPERSMCAWLRVGHVDSDQKLQLLSCAVLLC